MHALPSILDLTGMMTNTRGKPETEKTKTGDDAGFAGLLSLQAKSLISKTSSGEIPLATVVATGGETTDVMPESGAADGSAALPLPELPVVAVGTVAAIPALTQSTVPDTVTVTTGIALPSDGKTGKALPDVLPPLLPVAGKAANSRSEAAAGDRAPVAGKTDEDTLLALKPTSDEADSDKDGKTVIKAQVSASGAAAIAALTAALPPASAPAADGKVATDPTKVAVDAEASPAAASTFAMLRLPEDKNGRGEASPARTQPHADGTDTATKPAVTLSVADRGQAADNGGQSQQPQRDDTASQGKPAVHSVERAKPLTDLAQAATPAAPDQAAPTTLADAAPTHRQTTSVHAAPAQPVEARPDLTQIVERLAAAREALAPASSEISFQHREFGELSLRVDQSRDGQLQVALSARDADAHRAVAAAMAADRGHFGAGDQQPQQQASSQQHNNMSGQQRFAGSDRGAAGNTGQGSNQGSGQSGGFARQDQRGGHSAPQARGASHSNNGSPGGIFA